MVVEKICQVFCDFGWWKKNWLLQGEVWEVLRVLDWRTAWSTGLTIESHTICLGMGVRWRRLVSHAHHLQNDLLPYCLGYRQCFFYRSILVQLPQRRSPCISMCVWLREKYSPKWVTNFKKLNLHCNDYLGRFFLKAFRALSSRKKKCAMCQIAQMQLMKFFQPW